MRLRRTFLIVFMLFLLQACGKKEEYTYISKSEELLSKVNFFCSDYHDDKLYYVESRILFGQAEYTLHIHDFVTNEMQEKALPVYQNESIVDFSVNEQNELALLTIMSNAEEMDYYYTIKWMDKDGYFIRSASLQDRKQDIKYVNVIHTDKDNNVFLIADDKTVMIFSTEGVLLHEIQCEAGISGYGEDEQGNLLISYVTLEGNIIAGVDVTTGELTEVQTVDIHPSGRDAIVCLSKGKMYIKSEKGLYLYHTKSDTKEEIGGWVVNSIEHNYIDAVFPVADNKVAVVVKTLTEWNYTIKLYTFEKVKKADAVNDDNSIVEGEEKTVITYATSYAYSPIEQFAIKFNQTDSKYRVEVKVYSQEEFGEGNNIARMNADIVAGGVVDMIDTSIINYAGYANKGIVSDLYSIMEEDKSFDKDDYLSNIMGAYEYQGGLYAIPIAFSVNALFSDGAMLDENGELTIDGVVEFLSEHPETQFFHNRGMKIGVLTSLVACGYEDYVDVDSGEARFNSPEFIELLELSKEYGMSKDGLTKREDMTGRKILFGNFQMFEASTYQFVKTIYGDDMVFTGFPTRHGAEGLVETMAISACANSKNLEGVWEFIRFCLADEQQIQMKQISTLSPIKWSAYEEMLISYSTPKYAQDEDGNLVEVPIMSGNFNGESMDIYALSKEEVAEISKWLQSLDTARTYNLDVMKIIQEEASAYFDGNMDVETVASNIQNRVQMLLYEGM
ncbi:MAG: extracellular solute-binding protein [Lachnospiraceae bacterium]|nr:extracellular solute-binding protein [Lachnospiraceae bacterium]